MRLCINLDISKSVTKEEWKNVYEETLFLVKVFPLAELQERRIQGEMSPCLVRTQEHTITYGPNEKYIRVGWSAAGNYEDLNFATECFLPRCLPVKNYYDPGCRGRNARRYKKRWSLLVMGSRYRGQILLHLFVGNRMSDPGEAWG